ncbi:MAG: hypothetical protein Q8N28_01705 [bacterium]|nr:hypothetical protein [bacterium]
MTILIKNIQLIDGSGRPAFKADVLVKKEKIHAIGNFPRYRANEIIDGMGAYLSPGFIDINTESDHNLTLFSNPAQQDFLLQGITTIIGGQGGASLAPLIYGSLESIKEWANTRKINIDWHTAAEFFKVMERRRLGINFGTLVGHRTVRQALIGDPRKDLSRNESRILNSILEKSLKEGAFGFSSGLDYPHSRQISYNEIKSLAETTAKHKGVYAARLRDEKRGLLSSVKEIIEIAKETGVKVLINNLKPLIGYRKDYEAALELISKNTDKADVYFDACLSDTNAVLIYEFLPGWVRKADCETMLKDIQTPGLKEKILKEMPRIKGEEIILNAPANKYLVGKSLKEFAQNRNLTIGESLLELMKITDFRAVVSYKNISFKKTVQSLTHERAIVASKSAGKFLKLVEKEKIMPIEKAIYKITGLPTAKLKLKNRGLVREGYSADLVLFRDAEIREVILNGKRVVKDGEFQNILAGKILRH